MADLVGKYVGRYHILEQLGRGGMAVVYKAYDTRLERDVAIKFIRTEAIAPEMLKQMLKRFEREAKSLARMKHPYILNIYDFGEHEGAPYLVMEFLPGGTLKGLTGKPMPYQEAAKLLTPIARALEFAHERDVIHRDVKPANILLGEGGDPMLSDFGIAKMLGEQGATQITGTGMGVGTPQYMAPEQWTGKVVLATDIYALGVVLYELVTGKKPYTADTPAAVFQMQMMEPLPRPKDLIPELPEEVEKVIIKALAKEPEGRYENMTGFADVLERLVGAGLAPAREPDASVQVLVDASESLAASGNFQKAIETYRHVLEMCEPGSAQADDIEATIARLEKQVEIRVMDDPPPSQPAEVDEHIRLGDAAAESPNVDTIPPPVVKMPQQEPVVGAQRDVPGAAVLEKPAAPLRDVPKPWWKQRWAVGALVLAAFIIAGALLAMWGTRGKGPLAMLASPTPTATNTPTSTPEPTNTPTTPPTSTPTRTMTPTPSRTKTFTPTFTPTVPPPLVAQEFLTDVRVLLWDEMDDFDNWQTGYPKSVFVSDGKLELNCEGEFASFTTIERLNLVEGEGFIIHYMRETTNAWGGLISLLGGDWQTDSWRKFGIHNANYPELQTILDKGLDEFGGAAVPGRLAFETNKWYVLLFAVGKDGELLAVMWDLDDPDQRLVYHEKLGDDWAGIEWSFDLAATDDGEFAYFDNFMKISFSEIK